MVFRNTGPLLTILLARLASAPAVLVQVDQTQGSVPREAGTWMAVFADALVGTIGGGHLEYDAIARARALLEKAGARSPSRRCAWRWAPRWASAAAAWCNCASSGWAPATRQNWHSGWAGANSHRSRCSAAATSATRWRRCSRPCRLPLSWIDSRDGVFPASVPPRVACEHSAPVQAAVPGLAPQSRVLIMSFSHAEDLDVLAACLKRQRERGDLPYIGLIGSKTKWATFRHRLEARGFTAAELAHVTCPIGVPGISGKEPEVIAIAVAAQLLQTINTPQEEAAKALR
jgi:xanthine dehydrogenase accessory factor